MTQSTFGTRTLVVDVIKVTTAVRLLVSRHPTLSLVKRLINLDEYLFPKVSNKLDEMAARGVELLGLDRRASLLSSNASAKAMLINVVKETRIKNSLNKLGLQSLAYLAIRGRGQARLGDLNVGELRSIERFIDKGILKVARDSLHLNVPRTNCDPNSYYFCGKFVQLCSLSSKQIRTNRTTTEPILEFKLGPRLTARETLNWGQNVSSLTCTKHKDVLLRLIHGELYSKERLHRYGLIADQICPRCGDIERLRHKYLECPYVKEIWRRVLALTDRTRLYSTNNESLSDRIFCVKEPNVTNLAVHAEIINKIRTFKDEQPNLLTMPSLIARLAIGGLTRKETKTERKRELENLLD